MSGAIAYLKDLAKAMTLSPSSAPALAARPHPLDPLTSEELVQATKAIKETLAGKNVWFKSAQLRDRPKTDLVPFLAKWHAASLTGEEVDPLPRVAEITIGVKSEKKTEWMEYLVEVSSSAPTKIVSAEPTPANLHVPVDTYEMIAAEEALLNHPEFKAAVAKMDLPKDAKVVADAWIYGADSTDPAPRYITFMVYLSFDSNPDTCHYAAPLPITPTILADTLEMVRIDYTPIFGKGDKTILDLEERFPWEAYKSNEYDQALLESRGEKMRADLKPLRVVQPEGTSFTIKGRVLEWQKWSVHIGFNYREGVILNDVRYDGRRIFHRLSVSDMTVPYGDPRAPLHRKQAFDLGDVGAGICANELQLGCDCLGEIHYMDFDHVDNLGGVKTYKGVVCVHEQDDGIGWKHTNFRTGKPTVKRARTLVIQMVITVANYEYVFAYKLDQAAGIHLETRATGILSTTAILPGETSPYGNVVSPGVLATNHQHLFCLRIDPAIDGDNNTVVQEDSVPMPFDKANPPEDNKYGVGYVIEKTSIDQAGFADAAPEKNRVFKIINPDKLNPISGRPIGYKLVPTPSQLLLAHPDSVAYARADFGQHHIFVTKHKDEELYAGGKFTNQSNGNAGGLNEYIARKENVANADLVLWHTFGLTHNPRVEDFPVMPCETHMVSLKPADFFTRNPATDVPSSVQSFNQSTTHQNGHMQGSNAVESAAKANGLNGASTGSNEEANGLKVQANGKDSCCA